MKPHHRLLLALAPLLALTTTGFAQTSAVPSFISYQGSVATPDGTPVGGNNTPVNRSVVFRIWSHSTNSTLPDLLYSETQVVTIADGQFSVLVGEGVATTVGNYGTEIPKKLADIAAAFAGKDCYLGVTVAAGAVLATTDSEISPRQRIVSTGFAFRAKVAESLVGTASLAAGNDFTINPSSLPAGIPATNYGLGWYGSGRLFGTNPTAVDGPVLYGNSGGALGSSNGLGGTKSLALLWNSTGQVGIGATGSFATNNKLTLQGNDGNTPASQLAIRGNTDTNKRLLLGYNTASDFGSLQAYSAASTTTKLRLNPAGGNVGIGKDPGFALDVMGRIQIDSTNTDAGLFLAENGTQKGFIGQMDSSRMGFWGNPVGWGLSMNQTNGEVSIPGMVKMGAGNGTAEAPDSGIIVRRVQSKTATSGTIVAKESGNGMSVLRDGTAGGLILRITSNNNANAFVKVYNVNGTLLRSVNRSYGGTVASGASDYAICTNAEQVSRVEVTMADAINGGGFTELVLTRFVAAGSPNQPGWSGMLTSTTNQ